MDKKILILSILILILFGVSFDYVCNFVNGNVFISYIIYLSDTMTMSKIVFWVTTILFASLFFAMMYPYINIDGRRSFTSVKDFYIYTKGLYMETRIFGIFFKRFNSLYKGLNKKIEIRKKK